MLRLLSLLIPALSLAIAAPACKRRTSEEEPAGEAYVPAEPEPAAVGAPDLYGDPMPPGAVARLGSLRFLDRTLQVLTFTPGGKSVVADTSGGFVLWDTETASRRHTFERPDAGSALAVSPDGTTLATAILGGDIQLWDLGTRAATATLQPSRRGDVTGLCFASDEVLVSASDAGRVVLWDLAEGKEKQVLHQGSGAVSAIACGAGLVVWGTAAGALSWHREGAAADWSRELGRAARAVQTIAIARDGKRVAAGAADSYIRIWTVGERGAAGDPVEIQAHDDTVMSVAFTADGKRLISSGGDSWFREWNAETGDLARDIPGIHRLEAQLLSLSPDGSRMASWSRYSKARGTEAGRWWLWDLQSGDLLLEPERHRDEVAAVAFSPDGDRIASGSLDGTIRLWEARTGKPIAVHHLQGRVRAVRFAPGGKEIWTAGSDARLRAWDPERDEVRVLSEPIGGEVTGFDRSPDGSRLVTGDLVGRAWTFALPGGRRLDSLDKEMFDAVYAVAFSPKGEELAIAGSDRNILVIDVASGDEAVVLRSDVVAHHALAFSPDGSLMASGADDFKVRLWTTDPWQEVAVLEGHDGTVRALAFSPDGERLASGGNDETVRLWDLQAREELQALPGHAGAVTAVAYSPDGAQVASASEDHTVLVWKVP